MREMGVRRIITGHSWGSPIDSCEVDSAEARWSVELASDYEYECATREEQEDISRGAELIERPALSV